MLDKLITPIVQIGLEKEPDLPNVPLLRELPKTAPERQVLDFMSLAVAIGRLTPPRRAYRLIGRRPFQAFDESAARSLVADSPRNASRSALMGRTLADPVRQVIETPPSANGSESCAMWLTPCQTGKRITKSIGMDELSDMI